MKYLSKAIVAGLTLSMVMSTSIFADTDLPNQENLETQSISELDLYEIGSVIDYDIYIPDDANNTINLITDKDTHDSFMQSHDLTPGSNMQIGRYIYEVTDDYQLKIIDYVNSSELGFLSNMAKGDNRPTKLGSLPYQSSYHFGNNRPLYTSKYFNENTSEVYFGISRDSKYTENTLTISAIDGRNNEAMQSNSVRLRPNAASGMYFNVYRNKNFYFSLEKSGGSSVSGDITIRKANL